MAVDYSIKAIPTIYAGRRYRSRLEAKWAAFFDSLGWQAEYEPVDLGAWSPDFLLRGRWASGHSPIVLVEVKPIVGFDFDVATKMLSGSKAARQRLDDVTLLLVGSSPLWADGIRRVPSAGWLVEEGLNEAGDATGELSLDVQESEFIRLVDGGEIKTDLSPGSYPAALLTGFDTFFDASFGWGYRPDLLDSGMHRASQSEKLKRLWAEAANVVQWHPKDRGG